MGDQMSKWEWLDLLLFAGCVLAYLMARERAARAVQALTDAKAAIACWWRDHG